MSDIKVKLLDHYDLSEENRTRRDQALALLKEEFPNTHKDTNAGFFEWFIVAEDIESQMVVGVVTAQRYLPKRTIISDVVVADNQRGKLVLYKMWSHLFSVLKEEGYAGCMGYTEKSNRSLVKSFERIAHSGPSHQDMYCMFGLITQLKINCEQRILEYDMIKKLRDNKVKEGEKGEECEKSNDDWYTLYNNWY